MDARTNAGTRSAVRERIGGRRYRRAAGVVAASVMATVLVAVPASGAAGDSSRASAGSNGAQTEGSSGNIDGRGPADACGDTPWGQVGRAPFTDRDAIPPVHRANVDCAAHHAIVRGFADGTYRPGAHVRRDQMATFVAGTLTAAGVELPAPTGERFTDVPASSPHSEAIHRLAAAGIVRGGPGGLPASSYGPGLTVRRDQMASFLLRAAEHATGRTLRSESYVLDDVPPTNAHASTVHGAVRHGLARGFGDGTYRPAAAVRRDQMASFAVRLLGFDQPYPGIWPASWGELDELQAAVDQGHQPWRGDAVMVTRVFLDREAAQVHDPTVMDETYAAVPYTLDGSWGLVELSSIGPDAIWFVIRHEPATG